MFKLGTNPNPPKLFHDLALLYALPVMVQHLGFGSVVQSRWPRWEPYLYGLMAALAYVEARPDVSFIYFQF